MKKALSFAVALGLVAGMASVAAAADLVVKGDARVRGVYINNGSFGAGEPSDAVADVDQGMDQRMRFNVDAVVNDAVKINTRIVLSNNEFASNAPLAHTVDRANMVIDALGGTMTLGRQEASWGNKFLGWGASVDRIKYVAKAGNLTYGGYLQKNDEGNLATGDGDSDTWGALVVGTAGDTKWGVLANYLYVDTKSATDGASTDGHLIDAFFVTKAGVATILGEFVYKGGDAAENPAGDAYYGGFVGAAMGMDALTVKGLIAYYDGNMGSSGPARDCDDDFAPSLLIGTCQETAIIDFGGSTGSTDDSTYLVGAGADLKVNDKVTVGALVGYLMASTEGGTGAEDATLIEVDLSMKYALAQNTTYSLGLAYGMPDKMSVADDDIIAIGHRIDVMF